MSNMGRARFYDTRHARAWRRRPSFLATYNKCARRRARLRALVSVRPRAGVLNKASYLAIQLYSAAALHNRREAERSPETSIPRPESPT